VHFARITTPLLLVSHHKFSSKQTTTLQHIRGMTHEGFTLVFIKGKVEKLNAQLSQKQLFYYRLEINV
jgi:hypothetical protein